MRSIDEFKIIALSSDFGFITSSYASVSPPRIRGPGGFQMVVPSRTRRVQLGLNRKHNSNLLLNFYFDIIFFLNKGSNERKNGFSGIDYSKVQILNALFLEIYFENNSPCFLKCQTPYICSNKLTST